MICKFCERTCDSERSLIQHQLLCKLNPDRRRHTGGARKGIVPWNKGMTKATSGSVKKYSDAISKRFSGEGNPQYGKPHTKETILKMKNNPKCGGLRIGSGHGKMGWYKGVYCRSSWELAWLIYQLEHGQKVEPCKEFFEYRFNGGTHRYYPDFKIGEIYYEIKGQHFDNLTAKLEYFPKEKTLIMIDGKQEIKLYLDYVIKKYGKDFIKLYE